MRLLSPSKEIDVPTRVHKAYFLWYLYTFQTETEENYADS